MYKPTQWLMPVIVGVAAMIFVSCSSGSKDEPHVSMTLAEARAALRGEWVDETSELQADGTTKTYRSQMVFTAYEASYSYSVIEQKQSSSAMELACGFQSWALYPEEESGGDYSSGSLVMMPEGGEEEVTWLYRQLQPDCETIELGVVLFPQQEEPMWKTLHRVRAEEIADTEGSVELENEE